MIERVAECIRKLQAIIDVESSREKKALLTSILRDMKEDYDIIMKDNTPCPPGLVDQVDISLKFIEDMYNKIASN